MVEYIGSYLNFEASTASIALIQEKLLPEWEHRYDCIAFRISRGKDNFSIKNMELKDDINALLFFAEFLDRYVVRLKGMGVTRIDFYITYSYSDGFECNLQFDNLHRLTRHIDSFCVSTYNYEHDNSLSDSQADQHDPAPNQEMAVA